MFLVSDLPNVPHFFPEVHMTDGARSAGQGVGNALAGCTKRAGLRGGWSQVRSEGQGALGASSDWGPQPTRMIMLRSGGPVKQCPGQCAASTVPFLLRAQGDHSTS